MLKFILYATIALRSLQANAGLVDVEVGANSPEVYLGPNRDLNWIYREPHPTAPCGNDYAVSNDGKAYVSMQFKGVAISVRLVRYNFGAKVAIELDGVQEAIVDTYSSTTDCLTPVFQKTNLTYGLHTINLTDVTRLPKYWYNFKSFKYTTNEEDAPKISSGDITTKIINQEEEKPKPKSKAGPIAGGVVGGVLGLVIIAALIRYAYAMRSKPGEPNGEAEKGAAVAPS